MPPVADRVAALILAAGGSRRFGAPKLLARLEGKPLLQHALDAANASAAADVVVIVGDEADELLAAVRLGRARAVRNPDWRTGQASSLRAGVRAVATADAVIVLLGDQPRVRPSLVDAVLERQRATGCAAVVSSWKGQRSPPTLLHRSLWPGIESLHGDIGARDLLAGLTDVEVVEVTRPLGSLEDVDSPDDLSQLQG